MKDTINRLQALSQQGVDFLSTVQSSELLLKEHPEKWSKQEILGHLIDSGINNLQRFTEIQFEEKPFKVVSYNQDELVKANDYQSADLNELLQFFRSINNRILKVMEMQTDESLSFRIELGNGEAADLRFLMIDYVDHLAHHLKQIQGK
ncbi:DinB family protein [Flammeovirga aprica]|uniref:DinB family protein n=1 Tax=Flammeovirga aprica JL-4 TaxID=694437 RepID=A0A7X9RZ96_9BACT|nr:DinB family protein [Flammeovirga aprica]NME71475.1 DinB family protein [Flammeovirga aprica JL-4]